MTVLMVSSRFDYGSFTDDDVMIKSPSVKMLSLSLTSVLLLAVSVAGVVPLSSIPKTSNAPVLPGKFIIEVEDVSQIPSKRHLGSVGISKGGFNQWNALTVPMTT